MASVPQSLPTAYAEKAIDGEEEYGEETKNFISRNFYVDDGLTSLSSTQGAIDLVKSG